MKTRIYVVNTTVTTDEVRLIRAANKAQVRAHILRGYEIKPATQDDLLEYAMDQSIAIETARAEVAEEDTDE